MEVVIDMADIIRLKVIDCLSATLDGRMLSYGFARRHNSLYYKRKYNGAQQLFNILIQKSPRAPDRPIAALYPFMETRIPAVDAVYDQMAMDNGKSIEWMVNRKTRQTIEVTSNKQEKARWLLYDLGDVQHAIKDMGDFLEKWTIPFFDEYATAEDIISANKRGDQRIKTDRGQLLRVVAAALVSNQKDYAEMIMKEKFGALGLRMQYKPIFDFVEKYP